MARNFVTTTRRIFISLILSTGGCAITSAPARCENRIPSVNGHRNGIGIFSPAPNADWAMSTLAPRHPIATVQIQTWPGDRRAATMDRSVPRERKDVTHGRSFRRPKRRNYELKTDVKRSQRSGLTRRPRQHSNLRVMQHSAKIRADPAIKFWQHKVGTLLNEFFLRVDRYPSPPYSVMRAPPSWGLADEPF